MDVTIDDLRYIWPLGLNVNINITLFSKSFSTYVHLSHLGISDNSGLTNLAECPLATK